MKRWQSDAAAWLDTAVSRQPDRADDEAACGSAACTRERPRGIGIQRQCQILPHPDSVAARRGPIDPACGEYRQGNTMGAAYSHWRANPGRRCRLFFRYVSRVKVLVCA
ncbi:MAG: type II toxin-antitoxin system YhaV family toxin [Burkholderiaceae bacterium]|nr:type II toxin-antitoxin system YhaV family toxin [Burkholderiaceae bacterium]